MIAEVIVDVLNKQVNRSFDYVIPSHLENIIKVGYRVHIPFGNMKRMGFVVKIKDDTNYSTSKLKSIIDTIDIYPVLNEEFIDIAKFIAENNFSFYANALQTMIPSALKVKYKRVAIIKNKDGLSKEALDLFKRNTISFDNLDQVKQAIIYNEVKNDNVILDTIIAKRKDTNLVSFVILNDSDITPKSKKGKELVDFLTEINDAIELNVLINDCGYSKHVISTLESNKIISIITKEIISNDYANPIYEDKKIELNDLQTKVYNSVDLNKNKVYLLHGVTGSGKTEIYMRLIEDVIKMGKTAIMLVPEISLTPQITSLFKARFKSDIAILHSRLSHVEKYNEWKRIYNGEVKIVVGARSAIFAPLNNLGIIIIDECHEGTYVQQNNPKYNAIEIAKLRALKYNAPVLLGSATPNVCDYYYATSGDYELLELPKRANNKPLPKSIVVDMRNELLSGNKSVFSKELQKSLIDCYKNKEQSILFLNRRGYSSFVMCRSCGEAVKCPHCDVSLTYHAYNQTLKCHYCGHTQMNVTKCYNCGSDKIRFVGSGTEKIVDAVNNLIPEAKVIRLDLDTVNKLEDYELAFNAFKNHEADILIGTQMITKGLDFKDVTLVGVVNADLALSYPTFDATQVAYNLIEQVSGRAGRSNKDGKVIIQTYNPNHYVIKCASEHNYDKFYNTEIHSRKLTMMPPFSNVIEIRVSSKNADLAHNEAKVIINNLNKVAKNSIILGPAEALIFKKNDIFTFTIQIQAVEDEVLEKIKYIYPIYQNNKDISISITRM